LRSFSIPFSFLILVVHFHFTFCAISHVILLSVSILFRNADLNVAWRGAPDDTSSSSLPHLGGDTSSQWSSGAFHNLHRFADPESPMPHQA
jgi:hypothetical protein